MPKEGKFLTVTNVLRALAFVAFLVTTYFVAEIVQYRVIGKQSTQIEKTLTIVQKHVEESDKKFDAIHADRGVQTTMNLETAKRLEHVSTIQQTLQDGAKQREKDARDTSLILRDMRAEHTSFKDTDERICKTLDDLAEKVEKIKQTP